MKTEAQMVKEYLQKGGKIKRVRGENPDRFRYYFQGEKRLKAVK